ncbi:MAG TPA: ATP-binding protein [Coleofasciculaceae cyanobacterium]
MPHGFCYLWKPSLVGLHILSDGAIALAYFSIPVGLIFFIRHRQDIPFNWVFGLFSAFIIACGSGHLMNIWTLWHPNYWSAGLLKIITAAISLYTAYEIVRLLPQALSLPSSAQLEAANQELSKTIAQLQATQSQLVQQEKMSSLGQLVAGVAHEINNPVNFIHGNLDPAARYAEDLLSILDQYQAELSQPSLELQSQSQDIDLEYLREDFPKLLASMKVGTERIRQIVLSLRNFSRLDESEMKPVNIHEGIDSTLLILSHRLKNRAYPESSPITVEKQYGNLPLVECYAGQLNQVFMNLIANAIDALEERDGLRSPEEREQASSTLTITTALTPDDRIQIAIADNGIGMSSSLCNRIFNPFFTTKPIGQGTGLGLSISHQVITKRHHGTLECQSRPGEGSTFIISIPSSQTQPSSQAVRNHCSIDYPEGNSPEGNIASRMA